MTPTEIFIALIIALFNLYLFYNQQQIKSNLKKNEFVHKLQFEKEFELYELVWSKIIELKRHVFRLGFAGEFVKDGETFEQVKINVLAQARFDGQTLLDLTQKNRPFFYPDVFVCLNKLNDLIRETIIKSDSYYTYVHDSTNADEKRKFWEFGTKNDKDFETLMNYVCNSIRQRIGIISSGKSSFLF